jgi:hypothetical protein
MAKIGPVPEHLHTVTPRLIVGNGADAISSMLPPSKRRRSESESSDLSAK